MKKIITMALALIIAVSAFCSCTGNTVGEDLTADVKADDSKTYSFKKGSTSPPTSYTSYKEAAINFSVKTLSSLLKENDTALYSPMALYYQLTLLQNAASQDTLGKIKDITGKNITIDEQNECGGYFFSRLEKLSSFDKKQYIDINGDVFFNKKITVSQNFLLKNADFYNQDVFRLDFSQKDFTEKVNAYISEKTGASYSKKPDKNAGILLLNSAYMNDKWLDGFTEITNDSFVGKNKTTSAEFYASTEYYLEGENCEGFVKDLKNTPSRFVALVPKDISVKKLARKMDSESFLKTVSSLSVFKTCKAYIPRFESKAEINFTDQKEFSFLRKTGSYTGLSFNEKTKVSDIIQSFKLKLTKNGIGTAAKPSLKSSKKKADREVKLNKPFLFAIIDNESNIPIFMGVISDI